MGKKAKDICKELGHKWDEYHIHEVVCSRCRLCREYTEEDMIKPTKVDKARLHERTHARHHKMAN